MSYEPASAVNRPRPTDPSEQARWQESGLRNRMLHGQWREDAQGTLERFYDRDVADFLPAAVIGFNPFKSFSSEVNTLYADPPSLQFGSPSGTPTAGSLRRLNLAALWAQQQETLLNVIGIRDCYLRRSWDAAGQRVRYRVVTPDCIQASAPDEDPQQPNVVWELRKRSGIHNSAFDPSQHYWCWDRWDLSDPDRPQFQIVHPSKGGADAELVDLTTTIQPALADAPGRWPYWTEGAPGAGDPIWPWTAYHHRISSRLHDPYDGTELVDGTLIIAALWTFWVGGFRDVAHGQPYLIDLTPKGVRVDQAGSGQRYVTASPLHYMEFQSMDPARAGSVGQLASRMDVAASAESIAGFAASLALHAGLSPADVSIGNAGLSRTSGVAIEVSRGGKRRAEKQLIAPMRIGDQHNLAHAAQLANAYGSGSALPVDPDAYGIVYVRTGQTADEVRAELDEITMLSDAGLLHPADAIRRFRPDLTREAAEVEAIKIAEFRAQLDAARAGRAGQPEPDPDPSEQDETEETEGEGESDPETDPDGEGAR